MDRVLIVRRRAKIDLSADVDYLAPRNPGAAARFLQAVDRGFAFFVKNPGAGALRSRVPRKLRGLRSWPVGGFRNYLIFYLPTQDGIEVLRVVHGARNLGPLLREE